MIISLFPSFPLLALLVLWITFALATYGAIDVVFWSVIVLQILRSPIEEVLSPDCQYRAQVTSRGIDVRGLVSNKCLSHIRFSQPLRSLFWSPDGACLTLVSEVGILQVWNAWTGRMLFRSYMLVEEGISVAWSPDAKYLALVGADQCIQVWDVLLWECIYKSLLTSHESNNHVHCMIWSPTGRFLAIAEDKGVVRVWDGIKKELRVWQDNQGKDIIALAFSEEGQNLLIGDRAGNVSALDVMEGCQFWSYHHCFPIEAVYWGRGEQLGDVFAKDVTGRWLRWKSQQVVASL